MTTTPGTCRTTGIADRQGFEAMLDEWIASGASGRLAILFLRLDRLDLVNGWMGRRAGDDVLREVARRLEVAGAAARLGGATFGVLLRERVPPDSWADAVVASLAAPLTVAHLDLTLSCAAVLAVSDGSHPDAEVLLADAEHAARRALRTGRRTVEQVRVELPGGAACADSVAAQFQQALAAGQIVAEYQPIIDLRSMVPVGAEALARWPAAPVARRDPLGPPDFLELAKALGCERDLVDAMLRQACRDFASGPAAEHRWWVAVNLSVDDCADPTLPERVRAVLEETGLEPQRLMLEVSERAIPDPAVERSLRNLARTGVRLAIDDFGTGWSSLAQLRSLPISQIKIDRSLVHHRSTADARLMTATVALAAALGLETLAEGVETGEDLLLLCIAECGLAQGFWWSGARPLDEIVERFGRSGHGAATASSAVAVLEAELRSRARPESEEPPAPS